tara:strand:- start:1272 stop:1580 length:309 start_codon:yes stop_codon:yes gene_type:complete
MAVNYTQDQVEYIVNQYRLNPSRETVQRLAIELDKSIKSIIGKLSREGVYKKTEYTTKTGEKPVTKLELVQELAERLAIDITQLAGLEKAPKTALKALKENI